MPLKEMLLAGASVVGGLALFIFGMNIMTEGLRLAAGNGLRRLLTMTGKSRIAGALLGGTLGILVHSSATTVMLVGFVNAGLVTLVEAIPPILGANVGTTISMQAISLKLGDYCFFAIALGLITRMVSPAARGRNLGNALFGFGLLFLGMNTMGAAIEPYRELLEPVLAGIHARDMRGLLVGIGIAAGLTAIWQSSGATVGICFALLRAGVFSGIDQVFPLVLGAHIGTCATALLGSIGTNIEARRAAVAHLLFNIFNTGVAIAAQRWLLLAATWSSADAVRQTANLNTMVMLGPALVLLPFPWLLAGAARIVAYSRKPSPERSFLDSSLLSKPEQAIRAAIRELHRVGRLCERSFRLTADVMLLHYTGRAVRRVRQNEAVIDEIKLAMRHYLRTMTSRHLSRRQAILIQHIDRCMVEIERIGDHIDAICTHSISRGKERAALFPEDLLEQLFDLYKKARHVLHLVVGSLDVAETDDFQDVARAILEGRDEYVAASLAAKSTFAEAAAKRGITPIAGIYLSRYVSALDRIVRHAKMVALVEQHPDFWIKRKKLDRVAPEERDVEIPAHVDPHDFLDRLQLEDYL